MGAHRFSFTAEVWEHEGSGAWHFVSLSEADADDIDEMFGHRAGGFGAVRVEVKIGRTTWLTSIFPDRKRGTYVLPLKKPVRLAEGLRAGEAAHIEIDVVQ